MTTPSGEATLAQRVMRAELALAAQRGITRVYMEAWRELKESLSPGTPRVQLAIQMQDKINAAVEAIQAKPEPQENEDAIW